MDRPSDVVIVGGAAIGSATACFVLSDPAFDGTVTVVERDPGYQYCSSTRSLGGIRQQFSTPESIAMSRFALDLVRRPERFLAVEGEIPQLSFREQGYLFLASPRGIDALREDHAAQRACGAEVELIGTDELARRFPWLSVSGVAGANHAPTGAGWLDPHALVQAFKRKARAQGARYLHDEVVEVIRDGARVTAVQLRSGERLGCGELVNAAGPQAGTLAALAGAALPVRPRKRQVFVFACRQEVPHCPLVIDPSGVYFRPEGRNFLTGTSPPPERDPDLEDFALDESEFEEVLWPVLAARVPAFEAVKPVSGWAGLYDYNTVDQNAIIGRHPEIRNLIFANGFSGHGLQHSPAAGRGVSELIIHGTYRSIDLGRFAYERFARGQPLRERAIV